MYAAPKARESRRDVLLATIREIQLATIVVSSPSGFAASHVPVTLRQEAGDILVDCHVARANTLWEVAGQGCECLAVFQGPHAYVHPGWMPSSTAEGKAVPTWTYVAVHLHGQIRAVEDEIWLRRHLDQLASTNEAHRPKPWRLSDASPELIASLLNDIVGLELTVRTMEGIWKMAQGLPDGDRLGVVEGLAASERTAEREVAAVMRRLMTSSPSEGCKER